MELGWFYDPDSEVVWRGQDDSLTRDQVEMLGDVAIRRGITDFVEETVLQNLLFARHLARLGILNEFPTE